VERKTATRLGTLAAVLIIIAAAVAGAMAYYSTYRPKPFNVVLIIIDTLRADHLGVYGYARPTTPNLDAFAAQATVFEQAYSLSPWTKPSIASIVTGLSPRRHGIEEWGDDLAKKDVTAAELFQQQGYQTRAAISHVILKPGHGFARGFDDYDWKVIKGRDPSLVVSSGHISNYGLKALGEIGEKPLFLMLHYFDPHAEYFNHRGHTFNRGIERVDKYDSEIAYVDEKIGRVLDGMQAAGRLEDTVVVVMADHGEEFLDHGHWAHGKSLYDESVRVPLLIHVPGFPAARVKRIVPETDILPTLATLTGLPIPPGLSGKPIPMRRSAFNPKINRRVFMENYLDERCKQGVRSSGWKLVRNCTPGDGSYELYHIPSDPLEKRNLFGHNKQRAAKMIGHLTKVYPAPPVAKVKKKLDAELEQHLKGLGYLQ
jgi:arylsulfatase A-like enzyme